jgi:L-iditol 2-dehydrogenase
MPEPTMRAALLFAKRDMRVVDIPRPAPGPDEALVRVVAYAPYGTDISHYTDRGGRYARAYPYGVGADFSGVVAAVGQDVKHIAAGDRVTALALNHCGHCDFCRRGITNLCTDPEAIARARQACCQQFTVVAANKLAVMPDNVAFAQGAMLAGVVVALNGFELMQLDRAKPLVVVGVGAMGLAIIATATALGIATVALGGTGRRVDYARELGARVMPIAAYGEMVTEQALALSPLGFDQIIETTCSDWGLAQAVAVAGRLATIGITGGGKLPDCVWDIVLRQLRLVGISCGHHQDQALALMATGRLKLAATISHRFTLEQAPAAFELLAGPAAADVGRVLIEIGTAA